MSGEQEEVVPLLSEASNDQIVDELRRRGDGVVVVLLLPRSRKTLEGEGFKVYTRDGHIRGLGLLAAAAERLRHGIRPCASEEI